MSIFPTFRVKIHPISPNESIITYQESGDTDSTCDWSDVAIRVLSNDLCNHDEIRSPIFGGYEHWHDSVYVYTCLVGLFNWTEDCNSDTMQRIYEHLSTTFTSAKVKEELHFMNSSSSWMSPYAFCRFVKFVTVLHRCSQKYHEWTRIFSPILNEVDKLLSRWIEDLSEPGPVQDEQTSSVHSTAYCLLLLLEASLDGVCSQLYVPVCHVANKLYSTATCPGPEGGPTSVGRPPYEACLLARLHELGRMDLGTVELLPLLQKYMPPSVWEGTGSTRTSVLVTDDENYNSDPTCDAESGQRDECIREFVHAKCLADITCVLLSDWDIVQEELSGLPATAQAANTITRCEMITHLLQGAVTAHRGSMARLLKHQQWMATEVVCYAMDSSEGNTSLTYYVGLFSLDHCVCCVMICRSDASRCLSNLHR